VRLWIKSPLSIIAAAAENGLVVNGGPPSRRDEATGIVIKRIYQLRTLLLAVSFSQRRSSDLNAIPFRRMI